MDQPTKMRVSWALVATAVIVFAIGMPKIAPGLDATDWALGVCPFMAALMGVYVSLRPPKEEHQMLWFWSFVIVGLIATGVNLMQTSKNKQENKLAAEKLVNEIRALRTSSALRKQSADLASEIYEFVGEVHQDATTGLKPGQTLSKEQEARAFKIYRDGVTEYHRRFGKRISTLLREIAVATGRDTASIATDSLGIRDMALEKAKQVADRINAVAASLP